MKRHELRVGEEYIVAPPAIRFDTYAEPPHVRHVVLVDTAPWEYDEAGVPRPAEKGTGLLVVERAPDGKPLRSVLPIGQFRMTAKQYLELRNKTREELADTEKHLTVSRLAFQKSCAAAGLDGRMFGEYDGDTRDERDGRHWYEPRRQVVGLSLDTFLRLLEEKRESV